jgi:CRISPR-associated endonuclease/helicase Cas3
LGKLELYIAHKSENGKVQSIKEHLVGTSNLCSDYCVNNFKEYASLCGLIHDIGKYSKLFQEHINGKNIKVSHADCGAYEIIELMKKSDSACWSLMLANCIGGHHSGLKEGNHKPAVRNDIKKRTIWN